MLIMMAVLSTCTVVSNSSYQTNFEIGFNRDEVLIGFFVHYYYC